MKRYDFIVVGAGFFGAVMAEQLTRAGKSVMVLERREHVGGNCYTRDYEDTNINVHTYGSHIFHTDDREVWDYITRFTEFNRYQHQVLTTYQGKAYTMPINLGTINAFYNLNLKPNEAAAFLASKRGDFRNPSNLEEKAISLIGKDLYEAFIKGYTAKQWGCDPKELPTDTISRLPVRTSYNNAYFNDRYQGIPINGYTPIFEKMLDGIPVELGTDFLADKEYWKGRGKSVIYTGPIDRYFDYGSGRLKWRSVRFEIERLGIKDYQGASVINYADVEVPYTRIHEQKHLHPEKEHTPNTTVVMREYPRVDDDDPYYPVNSRPDREKLAVYQDLAGREPNVIFGGRLAEYRYYDMDDVIAAALKRSRQLLSSPGDTP